MNLNSYLVDFKSKTKLTTMRQKYYNNATLPGETWGMRKNESTLKGLNVNKGFVFNQIGKCYSLGIDPQA